ncbi:hypothetical protein [uncultured Xylophilus sp.]|uniref:hypothetical protein n=1 Tax=uncultured Xylophilus sp. TaxID=296832 RepID=UPI0025F21BF6|nr:hypothetical protein [uncultured Xylophilus sp.]
MDARALLQRFCALPSRDPRAHLHTPWLNGPYAYASNGHWMARMPAANVGDFPAFDPDKHPRIATALFDGAAGLVLGALPALPPIERCPECDGTLKRATADCANCEGSGVFMHDGHTYDCKSCNGAGLVPAMAGVDGDTECDMCARTGYQMDAVTLPIACGSQRFQPAYLAALADLPGIRFANGIGNNAARFAFDGGEGLLMPCDVVAALDGIRY